MKWEWEGEEIEKVKRLQERYLRWGQIVRGRMKNGGILGKRSALKG